MDYIISEFNSMKRVFEGFCSIHNIDYTPEEPEINNSTLIKIPKWLAIKRSVLNPNNNGNKCFQYSIARFLHHEQLGKFFCRISKIKPFINNLN